MTETKHFPLISGNLSLDLVNTELVRRGQRHDLLKSVAEARDWLRVMTEENALFCDEFLFRAEERMDTVFSSILELRAVLRERFELSADGQAIPESFIVLLEKKVEKAPFAYKLIHQKLIPVPIGEIEDVIVSLIAFDVLTLIEANKLCSLKRCSNPDCVLLFIDEGGRRKWCSMKICGNRKKVARFQHRKSVED